MKRLLMLLLLAGLADALIIRDGVVLQLSTESGSHQISAYNVTCTNVTINSTHINITGLDPTTDVWSDVIKIWLYTNTTTASFTAISYNDMVWFYDAEAATATTTIPTQDATRNSLLSQILQVLGDIFANPEETEINYHLLVDDDTTFSTPEINRRTVDSNLTIDQSRYLTNNTIYYWKVRRIEEGGYGVWSETRNFNTSY